MRPDTVVTHALSVQDAWRNAMLQNVEYAYSTRPPESSKLFRLFIMIQEWIGSILNMRYDGVTDVIGFAIIIMVVCLAVLLIRRSQRQGLLESRSKVLNGVSEVTLEPAPDIDRLIGGAVAEGNYRLAVRLLYRRTLAELRDVNAIVYMPEKTDAQYVREIRSMVYANDFRTAVGMFQLSWYGMETVSEDQYAQTRIAFDKVRAQLVPHL